MINGYAICFNEWATDKSIKSELGLLLIISGLTAQNGYCYATNEYLAKIFKTTEITISRRLARLSSKNYINITYNKNGNSVIGREIRLVNSNENSRYQKCKQPLTKMLTAVNKNVKDINTSNNNIHLHKGEFAFEIEKYEQFISELKKSQQFLDSIYMTLKLEKGSISKICPLFKANLIQEEINHKNFFEFKRHFKNWLNRVDRNGVLKDFKKDKRQKGSI